MKRPLFTFGNWLIEITREFGKCMLLFMDALHYLFTRPFRVHNTLVQLEFIGIKSMNIIVFSGFFTGMVLALNGYHVFRMLNIESLVGGTVAIALVREMGPVLAAIMVIARAGSAIAAELGTMKITEQVDALVTMSINPVQYLVSPRIFAGFTMMPILATVFSITGLIGSYFIGVIVLGINEGSFMANIRDIVELEDFFDGLIKSFVFGLLFSLISCYYGFYASGGAEGVGKAVNKAVVVGCVTIIVSDYFLSALMI